MVWKEVRRMEEVITELLKKASDTEWKYLLKLQIHVGDSYETLFGSVDYITCDDNDDDYIEKIVIPRSIPTVIRHRHGLQETVYIFTKDGWKTVNT